MSGRRGGYRVIPSLGRQPLVGRCKECGHRIRVWPGPLTVCRGCGTRPALRPPTPKAVTP